MLILLSLPGLVIGFALYMLCLRLFQIESRSIRLWLFVILVAASTYGLLAVFERMTSKMVG